MKTGQASRRAALGRGRVALLLVLSACSADVQEEPGPLSPAEALQAFQLHSDFRIELFAAEPMVTDPVELVFDEDGNAFVAEMLDYPYDPPAGQAPRSRIRRLEDSDGDGRADRSQIFAEYLLQVTSLLPWKGGLIVTAAPDILYLQDRDGDGRAEHREVLFTGFPQVNIQSRVTSLRFSPDNWIYAANRGLATELEFVARPGSPPLSLLGGDFRFRLDRGQYEVASGQTQFGQTLDQWGHRFFTHNRIHVRHVLLPWEYLSRNPYLDSGDPFQDISGHDFRIFPTSAIQAWRAVRTRRRAESLGGPDPADHGYLSGASGGRIYLGDTFPEPFRGNLFTGEVTGNLVHRDVLEPHGTSFRARRAPGEESREFLTSADIWFRPVNLSNGPDGNLYVVDMYREIIEEPQFIPEDLRRRIDFYRGSDRGRIYRILPRSGSSSYPRPRLSRASTAELAGHLAHPNGWWRLAAQRLLLERQDRSAVPALRRMARSDSSPEARLHALYALEGVSALEVSDVAARLEDSHPEVREHALPLAEQFPELLSWVAHLTRDEDPKVALQATLSLGRFEGKLVRETLSALLLRQGADRWFRTAVLSSKIGSSPAFFRHLLQQGGIHEGLVEFWGELASVAGARNDATTQEVVLLLESDPRLAGESWQAAGLEGLARGLERARASYLKSPTAEKVLARAMKADSPPVQAAARRLARFYEIESLLVSAAREALDPTLPESRRRSAVQALQAGRFDKLRSVFQSLLAPSSDPGLARAALEVLGGMDEKGVAELILSVWNTLGPQAREAALEVLMSRPDRAGRLVEALERGTIQSGHLSPLVRQRLREYPEPGIRERAARLLQASAPPGAAPAQAQAALQMSGDVERGRLIFERDCARCHLPQNGPALGPNLEMKFTRSQLLESILNPSGSIDPRYASYSITLKDGTVLDGILAGESPGMLTVRSGPGREHTLLRSEVKQLRASSLSLMPEGLADAMTAQDLADLLDFIQSNRLSPPR